MDIDGINQYPSKDDWSKVDLETEDYLIGNGEFEVRWSDGTPLLKDGKPYLWDGNTHDTCLNCAVLLENRCIKYDFAPIQYDKNRKKGCCVKKPISDNKLDRLRLKYQQLRTDQALMERYGNNSASFTQTEFEDEDE